MSQIFKQTSQDPYIRHDYKIIDNDGNYLIVDNWEDVKNIWFGSPENSLSHIEVLDHKEPKSKSKGFG